MVRSRILSNVGGVNSFDYATELEVNEGDAFTLYFQLYSPNKNPRSKGFNPGGLRYMPAAAALMSVTVNSIDDSLAITRTATQPYAQDPSIWSASFLSSDSVAAGSINITYSLTESGVVRTWTELAQLLVGSYGAC